MLFYQKLALLIVIAEIRIRNQNVTQNINVLVTVMTLAILQSYSNDNFFEARNGKLRFAMQHISIPETYFT